jgi:hypothetical protein
LEQQASQREAELRGGLKLASRELKTVKERCQGADRQLTAKEHELEEAQVWE